MKIEIEDVELVMDKEIVMAKNGTSGYIYVPQKYTGRRVKVCILEEKPKKK